MYYRILFKIVLIDKEELEFAIMHPTIFAHVFALR